ncbi:MAG: hypothetical protein U1E87_00265 [Alphaproteobacteria bacterium]
MLLPLVAPALADDLATCAGSTANAMELFYCAGSYNRSVMLAEGEMTAPALAFAARARLAQATFETDPKGAAADVDTAADLARRALKLEADNTEAHLQLAIALGLKGRRLGPLRAHFLGLGAEARRHIDAVLKHEPQNPWALSILGAWNIEIADRGGAAGRLIYGASREAGLAAYNRAVALAPDNLILQYERALTILAADPDGLWPDALSGFECVENLAPRDVLETELRRRAVLLAAAIRADDGPRLAHLVSEFRGGYERAETFLARQTLRAVSH